MEKKFLSGSEENELNAIKMSVMKAISYIVVDTSGKVGSTKSITVDIPCSKSLFVNQFVCSVPDIMYCGQDSYKCEVSASDLSYVFGQNWHICHYSNSLTRRRLYGLVLLHFRKKRYRVDNVDTIR